MKLPRNINILSPKIFLQTGLAIITGLAGLGWLAASVSADNMYSDSFIIQFGNFNVTSGQKDSASYNLTDTVGQIADGPFGQYGSSSYFVGSGFQYIYQIDTFRFVISQTAIDLGVLTPGIFGDGSHTLTITTRGAGGYTIYAYELHPLRNTTSPDEIPDTTCDSGPCTISSAEPWVNPANDGFGFNMTGDDVPADFVNSTYFRPFANQEASAPMQVVMSSPNIANQRQSTVTYQAAVLGSQAAGNYETAVVYVAVPGY